MAIKNSVQLTTSAGLIVPADNVIIVVVHFPKPTLNLDAEGNWDGTVKRKITYDLFTYISKVAIQTPGDRPISSGVKEYPNGWEREMTDQDYIDILANGMLAEVWLKDFLNATVPNNAATIINPFEV